MPRRLHRPHLSHISPYGRCPHAPDGLAQWKRRGYDPSGSVIWNNASAGMRFERMMRWTALIGLIKQGHLPGTMSFATRLSAQKDSPMDNQTEHDCGS
jgi:hypothetical protein